MVEIHEQAKGFAFVAEDYEQSRPEYPRSAIEFLSQVLGLGPGKTVVDVGAGTGKLSRSLLRTGARIIAVEPIAEMREVFHRILPDVVLLDGHAEKMPLDAGVADAVVAGQAFHWFQAADALTEFARVLRPHGRLGLVWNVRDERVEWVRQFTDILDRYYSGGPYPEAPRHRSGAWRAAFATGGLFPPPEHQQFSFSFPQPRDQLVARALSVSFIARLPQAKQNAVATEIRALVDSDPETRDRETVEFPYLTDVYWSTKAG